MNVIPHFLIKRNLNSGSVYIEMLCALTILTIIAAALFSSEQAISRHISQRWQSIKSLLHFSTHSCSIIIGAYSEQVEICNDSHTHQLVQVRRVL